MNQRWRDAVAFLVAPGIAAMLVGAALDPRQFLPTSVIAAAVTYGHAFILGVPVYLWLRYREWLYAGVVLAASFVVGAVPVSVLLYVTPSPDFLRSGASVLAESGVTTTAGLFANLQVAVICGAIGSLSGLIWLLIAGGYWRIQRGAAPDAS